MIGTELAFSPDIFFNPLPSMNFDPTSSVPPPLSWYYEREGGCEKWTTKDLRILSDNITVIFGGFKTKPHNQNEVNNVNINGCGTFPLNFNVRQDKKEGWRLVPH